MRTVGRLGVVLGVMVFIATAAQAQQGGGKGKGRGGQGPGGGGLTQLLQSETVQKELKLEPDQIEKIKKIGTEVRDKYASEFGALRDLAPEEQREKRQELTKKVTDDTMKALTDVLKPEQLDRFKQIQLQAQAQQGQAFTNPDVQKGLKLSDEQKEKIKTINDDARKEMQELFQSGGGDRQAMGEKLASLRKETNEKIMAVLNDEQKAVWKAMIGKHVDLPAGGAGMRPARARPEGDKGPPPGK